MIKAYNHVSYNLIDEEQCGQQYKQYWMLLYLICCHYQISTINKKYIAHCILDYYNRLKHGQDVILDDLDYMDNYYETSQSQGFQCYRDVIDNCPLKYLYEINDESTNFDAVLWEYYYSLIDKYGLKKIMQLTDTKSKSESLRLLNKYIIHDLKGLIILLGENDNEFKKLFYKEKKQEKRRQYIDLFGKRRRFKRWHQRIIGR